MGAAVKGYVVRLAMTRSRHGGMECARLREEDVACDWLLCCEVISGQGKRAARVGTRVDSANRVWSVA